MAPCGPRGPTTTFVEQTCHETGVSLAASPQNLSSLGPLPARSATIMREIAAAPQNRLPNPRALNARLLLTEIGTGAIVGAVRER